MKKFFALVLVAILALSCVSALAEADPFEGLGNYTMTVGHAQPESNPRYISMEKFAAFRDACQPVYSQVVEEGICTQAELDEMLAIVAAVRGE